MIKRSHAVGIEINPKLLGALLTDRVGGTLRIFCFYTSGNTSQFDVPADENRNSHHELFSSLKIETTCSSVIHDEAVRGRIYVRAENQHWLYTLLNSPGSVLPLNADLGDLPWKVIWRSQEMEALQYRPTGNTEPIFALRARMNEDDFARLIKSSNAFTDPVSVQRRRPVRWLYLNVGIALLALAFVVTGTIIYSFKTHAATPPVLVVKTQKPQAAAPASGGYFLLYNHHISGPFPAHTIAGMNAAGLFNSETMCRADKSTVWAKLSAAFPPPSQKP